MGLCLYMVFGKHAFGIKAYCPLLVGGGGKRPTYDRQFGVGLWVGGWAERPFLVNRLVWQRL